MASFTAQMVIKHPKNPVTNVRHMPNVDIFGDIIPNSSIVNVISYDGTWALVNWNIVTGYVRCKYLNHTQPAKTNKVYNPTKNPPNGKGASVFPILKSYNGRYNNCLLLGEEKGGVYKDSYNLFGGKIERKKDKSLKETAIREFCEEMGNNEIVKKFKCNGSPFAFNGTYIEHITLNPGFSTTKLFKSNNEMSNAKWFPIENIISSCTNGKKTKNGKEIYIAKDVHNNYHDISSYARGVAIEMRKHGYY